MWNILVTALIVGAFTAWWGFLFGSVIAIVLLVIFAPHLFFLPVEIAVIFIPFFEYRGGCEEEKKKLSPEIDEYNSLFEKVKSGNFHEDETESIPDKYIGRLTNDIIKLHAPALLLHKWNEVITKVTKDKAKEVLKFNKDIELLSYDGKILIIEEKGDYIWEKWDSIETYIYEIFGEETQIETTKLS